MSERSNYIPFEEMLALLATRKKSRGLPCQRHFQWPSGRKEPSLLFTKPWVLPSCQRRARPWQALWRPDCRWLHETSAVKSQLCVLQRAEARHSAECWLCTGWSQGEKVQMTIMNSTDGVTSLSVLSVFQNLLICFKPHFLKVPQASDWDSESDLV